MLIPISLQAHKLRLAAVEAHAGTILNCSLLLTTRLEEIESKVTALKLVSLTVELLGSRVQPALGSIADALPQVCVVFGMIYLLH